jgi:hypothetical protein
LTGAIRSGVPTDSGVRYAPFYCEENVLWLCPSLGEPAFAVLVTNARRRVEMRRQRAGEPTGGNVVWDYHAFGLSRRERWMVWDRDSSLAWPTLAGEYLRLSFVPQPQEQPLFRVVAADEYLRQFRSDRSHMLRPDGTWIQPPPPWPAPDQGGGVQLAELLDPGSASLGEVLTLNEMLRRYSA